MPSTPGYKRNYKEEEKTAHARGDDANKATRNKARRIETKLGLVKPHDGKDVDHIKPLSKGGKGLDPKNLRAIPAAKNRSYPRKPDGSMK